MNRIRSSDDFPRTEPALARAPAARTVAADPQANGSAGALLPGPSTSRGGAPTTDRNVAPGSPATTQELEALTPEGPELRARVDVHDHHQFELRFNYGLGTAGVPERNTVDLFLFIPRNVGVNATNYPRAQFYGDVTALLRLDAEPLSLDDLADPKCEASPLYRMAESLVGLRGSRRPPRTRPLAVHVKLYAYLFTEAARSETKRLRRRLRKVCESQKPEARPRFEADVVATLARLERALGAFRRMRLQYAPFQSVVDASLANTFDACDEYMSILLDEQLARLAARVDAERGARDGTGFSTRVRLHLAALAASEARYRNARGYLTLHRTDDAAGEYFTYRTSVLKKAVHGALYLNARDPGGDTFVRQAVGSVAAALGAIWAFALTIHFPAMSASVSGNAQVALFAVAVLGYVAKDRIKAVTNEYLAARLRRFDHVSWVGGDSVDTVGLVPLKARMCERQRFMSTDRLEPDIRKLRLEHRTVHLADSSTEEVLNYTKIVEVGAPPRPDAVPEGYRLLDIIRLNVRHFLTRLDEPLDDVAYFDSAKHGFARRKLPKVYHLNAVLRLRRELGDGRGVEVMQRLRVVLNQSGIVRVEEVARTAARPFVVPPESRKFHRRLRRGSSR